MGQPESLPGEEKPEDQRTHESLLLEGLDAMRRGRAGEDLWDRTESADSSELFQTESLASRSKGSANQACVLSPPVCTAEPTSDWMKDSEDVQTERQLDGSHVSVWDQQIEACEHKERVLHQTQLRMLRQQSTHFVSELSVLRKEVSNVMMRQDTILADLQRIQDIVGIEKFQDRSRPGAALAEESMVHEANYVNVLTSQPSLGAQTQKQVGNSFYFQERLDGIERNLIESAGRHDRAMESFEKLIGDAAIKHGQSLADAHRKLERLETRCQAVNERQGWKKSIDELREHMRRHATTNERLDTLDKAIVDTNERHARMIEELQTIRKAQDTQACLTRSVPEMTASRSVEKAALDTYHASLEERMEYVADKQQAAHSQHLAMVDRVQYLEKLVGDSASKHFKELAADGRVDERQSRIRAKEKDRETMATDEHHDTLKWRVESLENALRNSRGQQHSEELEAIKAVHAKRVEDLEVKLNNSTSRHAEMLEALKAAHANLVKDQVAHSKLLSACEARDADEFVRLEALRSRVWEEAHSAMAAEKQVLADRHATLKERMDYLETALGDSAGKHAQALEDVKAAHAKLATDHKNSHESLSASISMERDVRNEHHALVQQRMIEHHATLNERIKVLETTMGNSANKHAESLDALRARLAANHEKHAKALEASHARLEDLHCRVNVTEKHGEAVSELQKAHFVMVAEKEGLAAHHATLKERVEYLETSFGDSADKHTEALEKLRVDHTQLAADHKFSHDSLSDLISKEQDARGEHHASVKERLGYIEGLIGDNADKHAKELEASHARLEDLHCRVSVTEKNGEAVGEGVSELQKAQSVMAAEKEGLAAHHATLKERVEYLETSFGDSADKHTEALEKLRADHTQLAADHKFSHDSLSDLISKEQDARGEHHASLQERMGYIEGLIGDNADKHAKELAASHSQLECRLSVTEKHGEAVGEGVAELQKAHDAMAAEKQGILEHHATLKERVDYLETLMGDSADKHAEALEALKVAHAKSVYDLETAMGNADGKHSEALEGLRADHTKLASDHKVSHDSLSELISQEKDARDVHHASVQERLGYIEYLIGDNADKHAEALEAFKTAHAKSVDDLETAMGKADGKHSEALEGLRVDHTKLASDHKLSHDLLSNKISLEKDARDEHHATMQERLRYLEDLIGDNADKHAEALEAFKTAHAKSVDGLEATMGNVDGKHTEALGTLRADHTKLATDHKLSHDALSNQISQEKDARDVHHATMQERLEYIENLIGDNADKHAEALEALKTAHAKSVDDLEIAMGSTTDKHSQALEGLRADHTTLATDHKLSHDSLSNQITQEKDARDSLTGVLTREKEAREEHHASIQERLQYLEGLIGDNADKHEAELERVKAAHERFQTESDAKDAEEYSKLEVLNSRVSVTEKHGESVKALQEAHSAMAEEKQRLSEHHATLKERVDYLEQLAGDSADKHAEALEALKVAHAKSVYDLETAMGNADGKHTEALEGLRADHTKLASDHKVSHESLSELITQEKDARDVHHASVQERLRYIEDLIGDNADKHAEELEALKTAHAKSVDKLETVMGNTADMHTEALEGLRSDHTQLATDHKVSHESLSNQISQEKDARDVHHATMQERLQYIEDLIGDNADKHAEAVEALKAAHAKSVDDLEAVMGSTAEKHNEALESLTADHTKLATDHKLSHDSLSNQISQEKDARDSLTGVLTREKEAREEHHASIQERLEYLEGLIGDNADKHEAELELCKAAHAKFLAESEENDAKEFATLELLNSRVSVTEKHGETVQALQEAHNAMAEEKQRLSEHHATLKERVDYLETLVGDSADKHEEALEALKAAQAKSVYDLEAALGTADGKHTEALEGLRADHVMLATDHKVSHELLSNQISQEKDARDVHHATMQERLQYIEDLIGDNADKHAEAVEALKAAHAKSVDDLEAAMGSTADKHTEALQSLKADHTKLATDHKLSHDSLSNQIIQEKDARDSLTGVLTREKEAREEHHASIQERLEYLEGLIGDNADKHEAELELCKAAHARLLEESEAKDAEEESQLELLNSRVRATEKNGDTVKALQEAHSAMAEEKQRLSEHHATLKERVDYLEQLAGDSADKHAEALEALKVAHAKSVYDLEAAIGKAEGTQSEALEGLRADHTKLASDHRVSHDSLSELITQEKDARDVHHASVQERLRYIEDLIGDNADKHQSLLDEFKNEHERLKTESEQNDDIHNELLAAREEAHATMEERINKLEHVLGDSNIGKQLNDLKERFSGLEQDRGATVQDVKIPDVELKASESECALVHERLSYLEQVLGDSVEHKHAGPAPDEHTASWSLKERIDYIELAIGDSASKHALALEALRASHSKLIREWHKPSRRSLKA